jgi:hypothetical protein
MALKFVVGSRSRSNSQSSQVVKPLKLRKAVGSSYEEAEDNSESLEDSSVNTEDDEDSREESSRGHKKKSSRAKLTSGSRGSSRFNKDKKPRDTDEEDSDNSGDSESSGKSYKTSDELMELSVFATRKKEGEGFDSNRSRLEAMLDSTEDAIGIMEGLFKHRPTQGQAYALTNLMSQAQSLMSQLDQAYNFKELAAAVMKDAVEPGISQMLINLSGLIASTTKDLELEASDKRAVKKAFSEMLKSFAADVEAQHAEIEQQVVDVLTNQ